jgi:hypothetical protein
MNNATRGQATQAHISNERQFGISAISIAATAGYGADKQTVARESHVPEEIGWLSEAVSTLGEEIGALCARLHKVTPPLDNEGAEAAASPEEYRVPLAAEIRRERYCLQSLIEQVRRLNMAIEL